jgi:hypothetical protein
MSLRSEGSIDLPEHRGPGGFDHAAVDAGSGRLFVAHLANDALDVIDLGRGSYTGSIEDLAGVAGVAVSEHDELVFTSNRGAAAVAIIGARELQVRATVSVGVRPNGLAVDPRRRTLLAATIAEPYALHMLDVAREYVVAEIPMPGRTRWTVFDPFADAFFVNIADPPAIVVVAGAEPTRIARTCRSSAAGPTGSTSARTGACTAPATVRDCSSSRRRPTPSRLTCRWPAART